jgi:glutathionylspermidine synthase
MVPALRKEFNRDFTVEKYEAFLNDLHNVYPGAVEFRVAETPVFVSKEFTSKLIDACESIVDIIVDPKFKDLTKNAIPGHLQVPRENDHSHFIAFDFGVCVNEQNEYEPQLIEMQGFPSLFAYEVLIDDVARKHFDIPGNFEAYLSGLNRESYIKLLKEIIVKDQSPENVILLEIFPEKQKTKVDFFATEEYIGIKMVCLTNLIKEGKKLYYLNDGRKTQVTRIYNRIIFDELQQQPADVQEKGKLLFEELDVEWVPHPSWFYRISKYTMPFIRHPYVPATFFLNEIAQIPADLENYVLKPLFSFAGQGVVIDVTQKDIDEVKDPENWILQRKVKYAGAIETPDEPAKCEIRIFYFWKEGEARPVAANNLARLSKGKMIGVRYNKDKDWVGGTYCLFEK